MFIVPVNFNSVYISMVQTECCKYEFDTTYPAHLNGIISQGEFVQSIEKINRTFASGRKLVFLPFFAFLALIVIMVIVIPITATSSIDGSFSTVPITMGAFFGVFFLMMILLIVLSFRRVGQLRQAVAEESAKYSSRPTPCSWRLETTRFFTGGYGNNTTATTYHIIIDVGRPTTGAAYGSETPYVVGGQSAYAPPPYQVAANPACTQCGAIRTDAAARFCSSCGQAFK